MVTLKFGEISSFQFNQAIQKIAGTPTHGNLASQIHKVTKQLTLIRKEMHKAYQSQIVDVFGKRDEAGKIIRPEGEPNGFEPIEEKKDEFIAAQDKFGETEVTLNCQPFTIQQLGDIKISAADLEALKDLYIGNHEEEIQKPAIPTNVASLR